MTLVGLFYVLLQPVLAGRRIWSLCLTGWQRLSGNHCYLVPCFCGSCEEPEITEISIAVTVKPGTGPRGEAARCLLMVGAVSKPSQPWLATHF